MKKLLLHICCAPCSTHVIESLRKQFEITCYFYNPNLWPIREYRHRLQDALRYCREVHLPIIIGSYDSARWNQAIHGQEDEPEGGRRCEICFQLRLLNTARIASRCGFDYFGTTLTISPHKKADVVNAAGRKVASETGAAFYDADFKEGDGFLKSIELSKKHHLYRQKYCGCKYSIKKL